MFSAKPVTYRQESPSQYCGVTTLNPCRCCKCPNWERHGCHCPPNNTVSQEDVEQFLAFERRRMARRALDPEWQAIDPIENGHPCIDTGCLSRSRSQGSSRHGHKSSPLGTRNANGEVLNCCGEVFDPEHPCCEGCARALGASTAEPQARRRSLYVNPRCARGAQPLRVPRQIYECRLPAKAITFTETANAKRDRPYYTTCPLKTTTRYVINPGESPIFQTSRGESWYELPPGDSYVPRGPQPGSDGRIMANNPYIKLSGSTVKYTEQTRDLVDAKRSQAYVNALQTKNAQRENMLDYSMATTKPAAHFHRTWRGNY